MNDPRGKLSYVLPLRWSGIRPVEAAELARYLQRLCDYGVVGEVIVVDGSPGPVGEYHRHLFPATVKVAEPAPRWRFASGKVDGVLTGVDLSTLPLVVVADDDVRYTRRQLESVSWLLAESDLVRPQNRFSPRAWHTDWDTARTLINRIATGDRDFPVGDFAGTVAFRRDAFVRAGAYDGDLLFENLELMRTFAAAGMSTATPLDLVVRRLPPTTSHFVSQRVRQAYDDFAIPVRMALWLALLPTVLLAKRRRATVLGVAAAAMVVAESGRRRAGGRRHYPVTSSLMAPLWLAERALCSWLAVGSRLRGGVLYGNRRIALAAHSRRALMRHPADPRVSRADTAPVRSRP